MNVAFLASPNNPPMVDAVVGFLGDWIRLNTTTWFLWSSIPEAQITAELKRHFLDGDVLVVSQVALAAAGGWAPQWVWDWLNDKMLRQSAGLP